jgi:hypothetical protein
MTSAQPLLELAMPLGDGLLVALVLALDIAGIHMVLNMLLAGRRADTPLDLAERRRRARWFWWPFTAIFVTWIV